jgi:plasmid stability protein
LSRSQAEAEFRKVLTRQLRVQAPDHPETLFTRHSIAQEMAMRGKRTAAEAEFRDILAAQLRVQGPDHPHTLDARSELAAAPP